MQTGSQPIQRSEGAAIPNGASGANSADLLSTVLATLEDAKAEDIQTIDIAGKSSLGDHMIIASGRSHRHVGAVADKVMRDIKSHGMGTARVEGLPTCDWVLIDAGDLIIHIFRPEVREFYALEKMWSAPDMRPDNVAGATEETAN
ncbi:MAG: ribosome silencing factor [Pseudomonadota bacterium]